MPVHTSSFQRFRDARRWVVRGVALAVVAALMPMATHQAAAVIEPPQYLRTIGGPGHAGSYPWGAATAPDGSIYIGDYWNHEIEKYSPNGVLIDTISSQGSGPGQNAAPHGLAVDPVDGSLYVSDLNNGEIDKFDDDGNFLFSISPFVFGVTSPFPYTPRVAVNSLQEVFIVSSHDIPPGFLHRVLVFDKDGNFLRSFGANGTGNGEFNIIRGIAIGPDDEVFLADAGNRRMQVVDRFGTWQRTFGQGRFGGDMRGVVIDAANEWVYVSDSANSQIDKFTLQGAYLLSMGSYGTGPGQFVDGGRELTLAQNGNVYAPDMGGYRTNVFSPQGVPLFSFPNPPPAPPNGGFNWPFDVEVDTARNAVYVADTFNHRVQKFSLNGTYLDQWGERGDNVAFGMNYPRGIAVDQATGNVYLSNTRQGNVKVYTQNGNFLRQFGTFGSGNSQFRYARGIWVSEGRVWVADSGNLRLKATNLFGGTQFTPDCGAEYSDLSHEGCTDAIRGLDGRLYVASASDNQIYVFNYNNGNLITTFGSSQLRGPVGIAQTPDGMLWITELDTNRVSAYSTDGTFEGSFGSFGSGNNQFNQPTGIAADADGNIYVADRLNERIQVYSTGGGGADTTPPNATVSVPANNQALSGSPVTFSGNATDNVGVGAVLLAIRNRDTLQWWTGSGWGSWTTLEATLGSPGAGSTTWSYDWVPPADGNYALWVRADDTSGNIDPTKPWRRFTTE